MSFKENLLKKMKIDEMTKKVFASIGPPDSGIKIDKEIMRSILEMSSYQPQKERDLELYIQDADNGKKKIIVLDNELPIYITTVKDVAMRKSPTIKEMVNIRNAIKIINDKDVKISRKEESLKTIQKECIDLIDLSFKKSDLDEIENDGVISLERGYAEGVIESIALFADLLGYTEAPKPFNISHCELFGALAKKENNEMLFGPVVIYNIMHNTIKWVDESISSFKEFQIKHLHSISTGKEKALKEGAAVFLYLKDEIIKRYL
ncbi:MAG: hypothetical protein MUP22_14780 [Desulfobacterales bacterium]|nr:hypothetical protein [Desulfobacterales bacterium]